MLARQPFRTLGGRLQPRASKQTACLSAGARPDAANRLLPPSRLEAPTIVVLLQAGGGGVRGGLIDMLAEGAGGSDTDSLLGDKSDSDDDRKVRDSDWWKCPA